MPPDADTPRSRTATGRVALVLGVVLVPAAALAVSFLGGRLAAFDLLAHFRVQLTIACLLGAALPLATRTVRITALLPGIAAVAGIASIVPLYVPPGLPADPASSRLTLLAHNTWGRSDEVGRVIDGVSGSGAQVVFLQEMSRALRPRVTRLEERFEIVSHRENALLVARDPAARLDVEEARPWSEDAWLGFDVHARLDGRPLRILAVHLSSPRTVRGLRRRDRQLEAIARWSAAIAEPQVVIGDLNTTPWSHGFRALVGETRLLDSTRGHGLQPTYPCFGPAGLSVPVRIPIDHALHTPELVTLERRTGDAAGSNHRPLTLVVAWRDAG